MLGGERLLNPSYWEGINRMPNEGNLPLFRPLALCNVTGFCVMGKEPWRKVLYLKQDYPDNYVDRETFLQGLKKNC